MHMRGLFFAAPKRPAMKRIKLGISISLTGSYSVQGVESFRGLSLYVSDVNARGGIHVAQLGRRLPVDLVHLDDESDADICRRNVERLMTKEQADILLGPYSSSLALAAAEEAEARDVTLWNHGGSTDEMDERGFTCLVSAITPASMYSRGIIALVRKTDPGARRIAAFSAFDSGFSRNVARGVDLYGAEYGFEVRRFEFRTGREDFSELLPEAMDWEPDLVIGMGRLNDDLLLAGRMIDTGARPKAAALAAASIGLFREAFGDYAEGFMSSSQWEREGGKDPDAGPTSEEFFERYEAAYGHAPDFVAAQGYNIGVVIEECIGRAGVLDRRTLRDIAREIDFRTFYGRFKTDARGGQTGHEMVTVQWQGGGKAVVYPEAPASGRLAYPARFNF